MKDEANEGRSWAWCGEYSDRCGCEPLPSRAEAIADAVKHLDVEATFYVGPVRYAHATEFLPAAEEIIEIIEDNAGGDGFDVLEDLIFDVTPAGEEALDEALRAWAREHCRSKAWMISRASGRLRVDEIDGAKVAVEA